MIAPPKDLPKPGKTLWNSTQEQLREQGTWQDTDAPLLEQYVRTILLAQSARKAVAAEPFVTGSRDQLVAHPGVRVASEAARDAERYAKALLLTPESRSRHDIRPGGDDGDDFTALVA